MSKKDTRNAVANKAVIDRLGLWARRELSWSATLSDFQRIDDINAKATVASPLCDGLTPVVETTKEVDKLYTLLAEKQFAEIARWRVESFGHASAEGSAATIPVVALSYKHLKCNNEHIQHMTVSKSNLKEMFYRAKQLFQSSICVRESRISGSYENVQTTAVCIWWDRMLLIEKKMEKDTTWVQRGLLPYMNTLSLLVCTNCTEEGFEHFTTDLSPIDRVINDGENARVGDALISLWMAIEFDMSYSATSVISATDSIRWTTTMYSLPVLNNKQKELQTQVSSILARQRAVVVSGEIHGDVDISNSDDVPPIKGDIPRSERPTILLGRPQLEVASSAAMLQYLTDLRFVACLTPLVTGDYNFSRLAYPEDVAALQLQWSESLERTLEQIREQKDPVTRARALIDMFAPREFDDRRNGLDHISVEDDYTREKFAWLGCFYLLQKETCWKPSYTERILRILEEPSASPFTEKAYAVSFRHTVSNQQGPVGSTGEYSIIIEVMRSAAFPLRAIYICQLGVHGSRNFVKVSGRCSAALGVRLQRFVSSDQSPETRTAERFTLVRELALHLIGHGRVMQFLNRYLVRGRVVELPVDDSRWNLADWAENCEYLFGLLAEFLDEALQESSVKKNS